MDHKKAAEILMDLSKKTSLNSEEKEALGTAIGILSWTSLAKNNLKARKEKHDKDSKWFS